MIAILIIYLLFVIGYEHWGDNSVLSKVIYFAFQYGFVSAVATWYAAKEKSLPGLLIALIFAGLALNELLYIPYQDLAYQEAVNTNTPVYGLTIATGVIFIIHEILTKWKRKSV